MYTYSSTTVVLGVVCNGRDFGRATAFGAETNRTGCLAVTVICAVIASSTKERADTNTDTRAFENLCYTIHKYSNRPKTKDTPRIIAVTVARPCQF
jgi:hypothetical protein